MQIQLRYRSILDLDQRTALIILAGIISLFVIWHYSETAVPEKFEYSSSIVDRYLATCSLGEMPNMRAPLKLYTLCLSDQVFGNVRTVPFVFTVLLFPVTFLLASRITKNHTCGAIACFLLLGSKIVGLLGPTMAFSPDWALLFLGSIYMIYRHPLLVGPLFLGSMAMKGVGFLVLPILIYWIIRSDTPREYKTISLMSLGAVTMVILGLWLSGNTLLIQQDGFRLNLDQVSYGIGQIQYVFRHDQLQYVLIPISMANLFLMRANHAARSMLYMSVSYLSLVFLLPMFSNYMMYDYRMIPLIVLSAIGCAMVPMNPAIGRLLKFNK